MALVFQIIVFHCVCYFMYIIHIVVINVDHFLPNVLTYIYAFLVIISIIMKIVPVLLFTGNFTSPSYNPCINLFIIISHHILSFTFNFERSVLCVSVTGLVLSNVGFSSEIICESVFVPVVRLLFSPFEGVFFYIILASSFPVLMS